LISCEFIGRYKDDPLAYQTALRWTGVLAERAPMVATHAWNRRERNAWVCAPLTWRALMNGDHWSRDRRALKPRSISRPPISPILLPSFAY